MRLVIPVSPSLSRTGKPRHPYRATPGTPPRHSVSGTSISPASPGLARRPCHFTSPASSILQVFLIYAKFCYSLLHGYMEHEHQGPGPSRPPDVLSLGMKHSLPTSFPSAGASSAPCFLFVLVLRVVRSLSRSERQSPTSVHGGLQISHTKESFCARSSSLTVKQPRYPPPSIS